MPKCHASRQGEAVSVGGIPSPEFFNRWIAKPREIFKEEVHLLAHAPLDDCVALVKSHRQRLAIEDLLADSAFDEAAPFVRRRMPAPLAHPVDVDLADVVVSDFHPPTIRTSIVRGMRSE